MGIVIRPFASFLRFNPKKRLFNDYLKSPEGLKAYYSYLPNEIEKAIFKSSPSRVIIPGLKEYNERLGAPDPVLKNIDLLAREESFTVMTGQQPNLLLGPLFIIYKAIQTIRLSNQFSATYKTNFIPIFLNLSEDSDWDEVNHLYLLTRDEGVIRLLITCNDDYLGSSFVKIPLDGVNVSDLLLDLERVLPRTDFTDECLKLIDDSIENVKNFSEWFSSLMLKLLGNYGLILLDSTLFQRMEQTKAIFKRELEEPLCTNRLLNKAGKELFEYGYTPQIHKKVLRSSLFLDEDGKRNALSFEANLFKTKKGDYSRDELFRILDCQPERFSPDVAVRPIVASLLFPVLCYVAGPSEVSYYAQLKGIYDRYNLTMPVIIPRSSVSLMDLRSVDVFSKYSIKPWELRDGVETIANRLIRQDRGIDDEFLKAKEKIAVILESLMSLEPSLEESFNRVKGRISYEFNRLYDKVTKEVRKRDTVLTSRLTRAKDILYPLNLPQERVLNVFSFLIKYGLGLIDRLYEAFPLDYTKEHYLCIEVDDNN